MHSKVRFFIFIFLVMGLITMCRQSPSDPNPIFSWIPNGTPLPLVNEPATATVSDLASNPANYAGQILQLTGQFQPLTPQICSDVTRRSPATWLLSEAENKIFVGGVSEQLISVAPSGLTVTVEGRWWLWRGAVGCGKNAPVAEIWYLDVRQVLFPNPITQATLTPNGIAAASTPSETVAPIADLPSPTGEITHTPESIATLIAPPTSPTSIALITLPPLLTPLPATPTLPTGFLPTPSPSPSSSPTLEQNLSPTPSPTLTDQKSEGTATLSPTPDPTQSPTATVNATFTPSITPPPGQTGVVDKGVLGTQDLRHEVMPAGQIDQWTFQVTASTVLTVQVASPITNNMSIKILDSSGTVLVDQNNASQRDPEVAVITLGNAGNYHIQIQESTGIVGYYSLIFNDSTSFNFVFQSTLEYGDVIDNVILSSASDHFWHFWGTAGDSITLFVAPNDQTGNLFMELYGVDAANLFPEPIDDVGAGEPEFLIGYVLPATGLYALRVGEFTFAGTAYQILLDIFP